MPQSLWWYTYRLEFVPFGKQILSCKSTIQIHWMKLRRLFLPFDASPNQVSNWLALNINKTTTEMRLSSRSATKENLSILSYEKESISSPKDPIYWYTCFSFFFFFETDDTYNQRAMNAQLLAPEVPGVKNCYVPYLKASTLASV